MTHADPWDEVARLEEQMDLELLRQLQDPPPDGSRSRPEGLGPGRPTVSPSIAPPDDEAERP